MKRFAIKFPNGQYSEGSKNQSTKPVPFDKAKLWTNLGHVKNHLNGLWFDVCYPEGCEIVEVIITHTESTVMSVQNARDLARKKQEEREAKDLVRVAQRQLREAQRRVAHWHLLDPVKAAERALAEAKRRAESLGVKTD